MGVSLQHIYKAIYNISYIYIYIRIITYICIYYIMAQVSARASFLPRVRHWGFFTDPDKDLIVEQEGTHANQVLEPYIQQNDMGPSMWPRRMLPLDLAGQNPSRICMPQMRRGLAEAPQELQHWGTIKVTTKGTELFYLRADLESCFFRDHLR